jgi:hypothetical protein
MPFNFRHLTNARAFCLSVRGFVSPPICQSLSSDASHDFVGALCILDTKARAIVIAEIEFREIAVQMLFADVMVSSDHAALENGKIVFGAVDMDETPPRRAYSFAEWFTVPWASNSLPSLV